MSDETNGQKVPRTHTIRVRVRQSDTDYLGIVYNPVYLDYAMEAVFQHVESHKFALERLRSLGGYFVVRRHEIDYLRPARASDELLVTTRILGMKGLLATRATSIVNATTGEQLARAKTDYVFVRDNGRPGHIPRAIIDAFEWGEQSEPAVGAAGGDA
ncbi:MAG: acyl-CoA thioesterase [Chloroflexi bacterium]|nr:acyl-CoA thioesterase [Chloroflexota bacterium]MCL5109133.1 acyl-CoA thioesterase [Chloroflexota bacterium]